MLTNKELSTLIDILEGLSEQVKALTEVSSLEEKNSPVDFDEIFTQLQSLKNHIA
jgi:trimethylamine:corrinoid methyltransferase-like protein